MPAGALCITGAAAASLIVLFLIALFGDRFHAAWPHLFRYRSGHDVQRAGYGVRPLFLALTLPGAICCASAAIGGRISLMRDCRRAGGVRRTLYGSLSGYLGGNRFCDDAFVGDPQLVFVYVLVILLVTFGQNILLIFVAIGMVSA